MSLPSKSSQAETAKAITEIKTELAARLTAESEIVKNQRDATANFQVQAKNAKPRLNEASRTGNTAELTALLDAGVGHHERVMALVIAAQNGQAESVKLLMTPETAQASGSLALIKAVEGGYVDVVRLLLPLSDPAMIGRFALPAAAKAGNPEIIRALIDAATPSMHMSNGGFEDAVRRGHTEAARLILGAMRQPGDFSVTLQHAAETGNVDMIRLLMPVSNPKAHGSAALRIAAEKGHVAAVELLLPVSGPARRILRIHGEGFAPATRALIQAHLDEKVLSRTAPKASARRMKAGHGKSGL